ncbi:zillion different screens protein [Ophidiomyces ophidiicola]|nr:zillion different screens protein [Ophidiomyces ophidiicola]KAI2141827.1 zillion different screens protein [Ophidiomyces ophidiicola]KAI2144008.1 zillion different screens protein [Ophidiomyces ophidiicola]KAI2218775.1 zillion different screens protein [Ophidiomyces ophidiicola]KAI2354928.1 zillion different screens protein [Ophidiomyces ophidiicola]
MRPTATIKPKRPSPLISGPRTPRSPFVDRDSQTRSLNAEQTGSISTLHRRWLPGPPPDDADGPAPPPSLTVPPSISLSASMLRRFHATNLRRYILRRTSLPAPCLSTRPGIVGFDATDPQRCRYVDPGSSWLRFETPPAASIGSYARENGRDKPRRRHLPQLSISDENHHVTEAIGHMYDDDYDRRDPKRLSFVASQMDETISTAPISTAGASRSSPSQLQSLPLRTSSIDKNRTNGQLREDGALRDISVPLNNGELSPGLSRAASMETVTTNFEVNDLDYESDPAVVAQELSNLAALRRMSMDIGSLDPDLPSFGSNFNMPSIAPSSSADEDDTSRLFWVPARLHPGIAPKEFKTFLESKSEQIQRRSGELSFIDGSGPQRQNSAGGLRRKKSMLSRQVDSSSVGGRSDSVRSAPPSTLTALVEEPPSGSLSNTFADDKPILPPAPPGHSLRRSTRTTYRKGSLKAGERVTRRFPRRSDSNSEAASSRTPFGADDVPILGLTRVSTDPIPSANSSTNYSRPEPRTRTPPSESSDINRGSRQERPGLGMRTTSTNQLQESQSQKLPTSRSGSKYQLPAQLDLQRVEPSVPEEPRTLVIPERKSSHDPPPSLPPKSPLPQEPTASKSKKSTQKPGKETLQALNEITVPPSPVPSHPNTSDSSIAHTRSAEDKKSDRKSKEKKDSDGRKSSWHWRRSTEDKEKDKKKDEDGKKQKSKSSKSADKMHDSTRLDVLQASIDGGAKGREGLVLDRSEVKIGDDDRRKDKKSEGGDVKKEKESSLFSSIFGGSKKKSGHDSHKKYSRNVSPDTRIRELRPDIDYSWTRFSLIQERAIYRMAHLKLANPRRELYSQVLLSNFMYSYLAKVQQMHPHMSLPTSAAQNQQRKKEQQQQQQQDQQQLDEFSQYQEYAQAESDRYDDGQAYADDDRVYYDTEENENSGRSNDPGISRGAGQRAHAPSNGNASQRDENEMW